MEQQVVSTRDLAYRIAFRVAFLISVAGLSFVAGLAWSTLARAEESRSPRVIYPKESKIDLDETPLEGELRNPGDFYFQHRPEDRFDSLVKRRKNFHKEMLRDVVLSR